VSIGLRRYCSHFDREIDSINFIVLIVFSQIQYTAYIIDVPLEVASQPPPPAMPVPWKSISPYYVVSPPPSSLPLVLAETDLSICIPVLLSETILNKASPLRRVWLGYPVEIVKGFENPAAKTASQPGGTKPPVPAPSEAPSPAPSKASELSELPEPDEDWENRPIIPKPNGEPGRPNAGGYNLEDAVGWDAKKYGRMKVGSVFEPLFPSLKLPTRIWSTSSRIFT
jgi:hypothetical protein